MYLCIYITVILPLYIPYYIPLYAYIPTLTSYTHTPIPGLQAHRIIQIRGPFTGAKGQAHVIRYVIY
jgi:hypothetical protein